MEAEVTSKAIVRIYQATRLKIHEDTFLYNQAVTEVQSHNLMSTANKV
jgi:hypothetical protein